MIETFLSLISDPKCGAADESKRAINVRGLTVSVENYNTLLNCSESIKEACDIDLLPTYNKTEQSEREDTQTS